MECDQVRERRLPVPPRRREPERSGKHRDPGQKNGSGEITSRAFTHPPRRLRARGRTRKLVRRRRWIVLLTDNQRKDPARERRRTEGIVQKLALLPDELHVNLEVIPFP